MTDCTLHGFAQDIANYGNLSYSRSLRWNQIFIYKVELEVPLHN